MNGTSVRASYDANGYHLERGLFAPEEVERVRREAKSLFNVQLRSHGLSPGDIDDDEAFTASLRKLFEQDHDAFLGAAKQCQHLISLHELSFDRRVIDILTDTLGIAVPTICVKPIIFFNSRHLAKIEGHYKTPAHQDWRSMQGSLDSVVVWIALMDIDTDLGALEIVPQSHLSGLLDTVEDPWYRTLKEGQIEDEDFERVEVEAGDVLFFSSLLVHRSGDNVTDAIRWSVHVRYNNAVEETFVERKFPHPYVVYRPNQELEENPPTPEVMPKVFPNGVGGSDGD